MMTYTLNYTLSKYLTQCKEIFTQKLTNINVELNFTLISTPLRTTRSGVIFIVNKR